MLTETLTYTDFDDNEVTETFHFNLTETELVELEVYFNDGLEKAIRRIVASDDRKTLIAEFKRILLLSYGKRTDGSAFIKNDELREHFQNTAAFDHLFMRMASDEEYAANFIMKIMPPKFAEAYADQDKPKGPAPTSRTATPPPPPPLTPPAVNS